MKQGKTDKKNKQKKKLMGTKNDKTKNQTQITLDPNTYHYTVHIQISINIFK